MSNSQARQYLICYDIRQPDRLSSVHRYMVKHAIAVQYSVFLAFMTPLKMQCVMDGVAALIDLHEDDVRCYALPAKLDVDTLGRQSGLGEGLMLIIDGHDVGGLRGAA